MTTEFKRQQELERKASWEKEAQKYDLMIAATEIPMSTDPRHGVNKCCAHIESKNTVTMERIYGHYDMATSKYTHALYLCYDCHNDLRSYMYVVEKQAQNAKIEALEQHKKAKDDALFDIAVAMKQIVARLDKLDILKY